MSFYDPEPAVVSDLSVVAQLTALMEFIPIGIVVAGDPLCATMWANRAAQAIFRTQYSASLLEPPAPVELKAGFRAFRNGSEIERGDMPLQQAVRDNRGVSGEHELLLEDGVLLHVVITAAPLRTPSGEVSGGIAAIVDVTRERRDAALTQLVHECSAISASLDVDEALLALVALLARRVADRGEIYLLDGSELHLAAAAQRGAGNGEVTPRLAGALVEDDHPAARALFSDEPLLAIDGERSSIYARLVTRERTIGSIGMIGRRQGRAFDLNDLGVAKAISEQAAIELEKSLLYAETRRSAARMKLLSDVGLAFSRSLDFQERLDAIARSIPPELADIVMVNLVEPDGRIRTVAAWHADPRYRSIARAWSGRILIDANSRVGTPAVIRRGIPQVRRFTTEPNTPFVVSDLPLPGRDPRFAIAASLVVPLASEQRVVGTLVCIKSQRGARYSEEDRSLFALIGQRAGVALDNAVLYERERRVADRFARAQLPQQLPVLPGYRFSTTYVAGSAEAEVGGDWCDVFELPDGRIALAIGDVMGSGIDSAIVMAKLRQAMRVGAFLEPTVSRMVDAADFTLREEHPDVFATALAAILEPRSGVLRFVAAGHPLPILRRSDGKLVEMESCDPPLGVNEGPQRRTIQAVMLDAGSLLVCYTDGLIEGGRDAIAGEELLREIVAQFEPNGDAARRIYNMMSARLPSRDDVAVITVAAAVPIRAA